MLEDIIRLLHEGKHSLVVSNGEVRTFDRRGVADLYALLQEDSDFLKGASVADKVRRQGGCGADDFGRGRRAPCGRGQPSGPRLVCR